MREPEPDPAELAAFSAAFDAMCRDPQPIVLELSKALAWILMAQLQLALRHPANTGATALQARGLAERLQQLVAGDSPILLLVAEKGWRPALDEDPTDPQWAVQTLAHVLDHLRAHAREGCKRCTAWVRGHGGGS